MPSYVVNGGLMLNGELDIQGSKNAALPLIAAALLNQGITILHNCPDISDVSDMAKMLEYIGCHVSRKEHTVIIDASDINKDTLPEDISGRVRASVLITGAMIARTGRFVMNYPGGCMIGARPVDFHLEAFRKMNVHIRESDGKLECFTDALNGNLVKLPFPSVGATENVLLATVYANGTTILQNAAREPEISELCDFLVNAGAIIHGAGTSEIVISGGHRLHDSEYSISSDRIAAGTYMCAAVASRGGVCCRVNNVDMFSGISDVLKQMGCSVSYGNDYLSVLYDGKIKSIPYLKTLPFPGFPTDMQSQVTSVLALGQGVSVIEETIFEARFHIVKELIKLGADIKVDGRRIIITGVDSFTGAELTAAELRGGAALLVAGMSASGISIIKDNAGYIERGYENISGNINQLGGKVQFGKEEKTQS